MSHFFGLDEEPAADFSARITRQGRSHGLTMRARRKLVYRRIGVLALAIAVPAMASPAMQADDPAPLLMQPQTEVATRQPALLPAWSPAIDRPADASSVADPGPAARPFFAALGNADRSRAEQCLAMAVYYEAASESIAGQRAVAQVVMNRVRHPSWPASVCGVVFEGSERATGCQFSFTCDGSLGRQPQAAAMARARMVARAALGGYVYAPVGLATHYHRTDIYPYWAPSLAEVGTIGLHRFYRWTGAAGRPAAFSASYSGNETMPLRRRAPAPTTDEASSSALAALPSAVAPTPAHTRAPQAAPAAPPAGPRLPQSGSVLEQHARSGQWLRDPR